MLELEFNTKDFSKFPELAVFDQKQVNKAMSRALNRLVRYLKTHALRGIVKKTGIPRKYLLPRFYISNAKIKGTVGGLDAGLWIGTWRIPLFKAAAGKVSQTKKGVRAGKFGVIENAFIATMPNGHRGVWRQTTENRLPIKEIKINIDKDVDEVVSDFLKKKIPQRFEQELKNQLNYIFKKQAA